MSNQGRRVIGQTGLVYEYSPVTVDAILTPEDARRNGIETNKHRVQLRQEVRVTYPAARGNALFTSGEFGPGKDFTEKRVTWLNVPSGTSIEQIQERLNSLESPTLVRTLGLKPILSQDQITAMEKGINTKTWEQYAENFVRTSDTGTPVLFAGHQQYRAIHFSDSFAEDNDNRIQDLKELQAAQSEAAHQQVSDGAIEMSSGVAAAAETAPATL